jgi:hypothetical protein
VSTCLSIIPWSHMGKWRHRSRVCKFHQTRWVALATLPGRRFMVSTTNVARWVQRLIEWKVLCQELNLVIQPVITDCSACMYVCRLMHGSSNSCTRKLNTCIFAKGSNYFQIFPYIVHEPIMTVPVLVYYESVYIRTSSPKAILR